jgi:hypothetical protein
VSCPSNPIRRNSLFKGLRVRKVRQTSSQKCDEGGGRCFVGNRREKLGVVCAEMRFPERDEIRWMRLV